MEDAEGIVRHARPGDVCLFYNEFLYRYRQANHALRRKQCATLYALDGIFESPSLAFQLSDLFCTRSRIEEPFFADISYRQVLRVCG
jgi:hypothetical protein